MHPVVVILVPLLLGFVIGKFFTATILLILTVISVVIAVYLFAVTREIEQLIALLYTYAAVILNISMWVTFYLATDQHWIGNFLHTYILR